MQLIILRGFDGMPWSEHRKGFTETFFGCNVIPIITPFISAYACTVMPEARPEESMPGGSMSPESIPEESMQKESMPEELRSKESNTDESVTQIQIIGQPFAKYDHEKFWANVVRQCRKQSFTFQGRSHSYRTCCTC